MEKRILLSVVVGGLLVLAITGAVFAGIEPSPFQPQISKLHSIGLTMAVTQKVLDGLVTAPSLPRGTKTDLLASRYELQALDTLLANVLSELPPFDKEDDGRKGVFLALESIKMVALGMEDPLDYILSRMGITPSPFKGILDSITGRIDDYLATSCVPGTACN
jgi:hypothetical protein